VSPAVLVSYRTQVDSSSEITFVFGRPHPLQPSADSTPYDSTLAEVVSDYWVARATSGNPNGPPTRGKVAALVALRIRDGCAARAWA
jgi:carboxylesterase type B